MFTLYIELLVAWVREEDSKTSIVSRPHFTISFSKGLLSQGRIQDFWKGGSYIQPYGVRFDDFISFFLNIP